ncbi:universal stress protein [Pseudothauera rhizosphaerae]|uniref:Universal stress protein UspA n=1 Tax=Pseudothauera rhizosphaerae TaxID=2565932 RepID=A0A4S4A8L8_9RHOO|nr:universal stress protein [Pseudothauera rhizosphaerae]THF55175.1 universal stress protein UspA [Pseudothauera rhizosphaerae]
MYRHLLVPLDGSELATTLVSGALELARALGARITFFSMREDYGASQEGALARTLSPDTFAAAAAGGANAIVAKALAAAEGGGVECAGLVRTGSRPHELIVQVADECGCDLIYMASHGRRGLKALMPGSQTQKVLAHTTLPVLVATVEANAASTASEAAIAVIQDEHRSIAAVINGLRRLAARARAGGEVDFGFLGAMLHYLRSFAEVQHHPKEEQYLFARLEERSDELADVLYGLRREHREGTALLAELEARAAECCAGAAEGAGDLAEAIDRFADAQWRHLSAEEKLVLPAARRHLTEEDWLLIGRAFRDEGDLARGSERDAAYAQMFARLMNQAADEALG